MRDESKPVRILLCEDSLEGILTAVYEAYQSRYGHDNIKLCLRSGDYEMELFSVYENVEPDSDSTNKVLHSIMEKIGEEARQYVMEAAYSAEPDKAEVIYRYLIRGFAFGRKINSYLAEPYVSRMLAVSKRFSGEAHRWLEFLRFQVQENGLLTAVFEPKGRVLTFIMPHFADRFPMEDFMIYDKTHDQAGIHRKQQGWFLVDRLSLDYPEYAQMIAKTTGEEAQMQELWRIFFHTIAIKERENPALQRQFLPKWCRTHMTEWGT